MKNHQKKTPLKPTTKKRQIYSRMTKKKQGSQANLVISPRSQEIWGGSIVMEVPLYRWMIYFMENPI
jgi:hypothetical protein